MVSGIGWGMCTDRGSALAVAMREIGVLGLVSWGSKWSSRIHAEVEAGSDTGAWTIGDLGLPLVAPDVWD